ncbi:Uncharacterised protein [Cedecea neteri]|uniref:Uncharacterized protein n=1 Tax=Cedecea neteri TaxID=158822 RepID=A0A2X2V8J2_9ENTR|nr:Uncharacterised protein [Cedecea neteri]
MIPHGWATRVQNLSPKVMNLLHNAQEKGVELRFSRTVES